MILFTVCIILAIISAIFISTGSIVLIILGADLIVCIALIWKLLTRKKHHK